MQQAVDAFPARLVEKKASMANTTAALPPSPLASKSAPSSQGARKCAASAGLGLPGVVSAFARMRLAQVPG